MEPRVVASLTAVILPTVLSLVFVGFVAPTGAAAQSGPTVTCESETHVSSMTEIARHPVPPVGERGVFAEVLVVEYDHILLADIDGSLGGQVEPIDFATGPSFLDSTGQTPVGTNTLIDLPDTLSDDPAERYDIPLSTWTLVVTDEFAGGSLNGYRVAFPEAWGGCGYVIGDSSGGISPIVVPAVSVATALLFLGAIGAVLWWRVSQQQDDSADKPLWTPDEKAFALEKLGQQMKKHEAVVEKLSNRVGIANDYFITASEQETSFREQCDRDEAWLDVSRRLFLSANLLLAASALGGLGASLTRIAAKGLARRAGLRLLHRGKGRLLVRSRKTGDIHALDVTKLNNYLRRADTRAWAKVLEGLGVGFEASRLAVKSFAEETGPVDFDSFELPPRAADQAGPVDFDSLELPPRAADRIIDKARRAQEDAWDKVEAIARDSESPSCHYLAYWEWVRQTWHSAREASRALLDEAGRAVDAIKEMRDAIEDDP